MKNKNMYVNGTLFPYVRKSNGKYGYRTRWNEVLFLASFALISVLVICYVLYSPSVGAEKPIEGKTDFQICDKISDGVYDCTKNTLLKEKFSASMRAVNELPVRSNTKKALVTMYTSRVEETDASPCIAANGKDICKLLDQGVQTCASNDYKMGTKLHIEKLGECIIMDRMNVRYTGTGRVDWYAGHDLKRAVSHGVKSLAVSIKK